MKRLAFLVSTVALVAPTVAAAHTPHKVSEKQPLKQQYKLVKKNLQHSEGVVRWCKNRDTWFRACAWHSKASRWQERTRTRLQLALEPKLGVEAAICAAFGPYCSQALRVASCESGLYIYASNGQYLGLFQMGSYARSKYGHGSDAWTQAKAAAAYFRDAGGWGPWSCRP